MNDTPRTDEWYVTDTDYGTPEVFDKIRNDTICGIYGGKTIGEQYDIAARIAKLPDLERELTAMTKQRDRLAEALEQILSYQGRFAEEDPESIASEALQYLNNFPQTPAK